MDIFNVWFIKGNQVVDVNLLGSRRPLRVVAPSPGSFRPTTPQAQHDVEAAGTTPPGEPTSTSQGKSHFAGIFTILTSLSIKLRLSAKFECSWSPIWP